jgi:hypothetical protein
MVPEHSFRAMAFVDDAKKYVLSLKVGSAERLILDYLLNNAAGRNNARAWPEIDEFLQKNGHKIRQQRFQQGLLKSSREGTIFIAANDHGESRGYFLIKDRQDAEIMQNWYRRRIQTEQGHLDQLNNLVNHHFGKKP